MDEVDEVDEVEPNTDDPIAVVNRVIEALLPLVEDDCEYVVEPADRVSAGRAICDAVALRETLKLGADPKPKSEGVVGPIYDAPNRDDEDDAGDPVGYGE